MGSEMCIRDSYTGTAVPPATLARKEACIGITDRCKVDGSTFSVKTGDLPMPRALRSRKTNWTQHACTYMCLVVRTLIGTNLVCCLVQGGCAVLCCALLCSWFNVIHTRTYYKGASRRAALAARRIARRLHAMSSAVVVFAI